MSSQVTVYFAMHAMIKTVRTQSYKFITSLQVRYKSTLPPPLDHDHYHAPVMIGETQ